LTGCTTSTIRLRFIHDSKRAIPCFECEGTIAALQETIVDYQSQGCGVFYILNETKPGITFARDSDVTGIRALAADFDHGLPSKWHAKPPIIVHSSIKEGVQLSGRLRLEWRLRTSGKPSSA
jgi:hypothetical protein